MSIYDATRFCIVVVNTGPVELEACLWSCRRARGAGDWTYLFALDKGFHPKCLELAQSYPAQKQIISAPPRHPYPQHGTYNVLGGIRSALSFARMETAILLPSTHVVSPGFFAFFAELATYAAEADADLVPFAVSALPRPAGPHPHPSPRASSYHWPCSSLRRGTLELVDAAAGENYFVAQPTYVKKTHASRPVATMTIDQFISSAGGETVKNPTLYAAPAGLPGLAATAIDPAWYPGPGGVAPLPASTPPLAR